MSLRVPAAAMFAAALALAPLVASATSSPNPSLDTVLVAPPSSDFTELTTSPLHGKFSAHDWAALSGNGPDASQTEATLNKDGFIDGFGKTWAQQASGHALIEAVMAFSGGRGAQSALTGMEASDKSDSTYKNADTVTGISTYYGAHFVDVSNQLIEDFFAFVKGNDVFGIAFVSPKDDVLDAATRQVRDQYSHAPGATIPRSQWPENASPSASISIGIVAAGIGFIVVVMGLVTFLVLRRRTPQPTAAYASYVPALSMQMSPDGNYWWDGQSWRDAAQFVPPDAQRSDDGAYWWDGRAWRAVPPQPPAG
ncbi:MAG TPA: hypothetical protein VFR33_12645 [Candidatus Dormibacteraeota bacterium]|nr:hypothetical protein [Candidatus Dormibacteraeota bacterium]